MRTGLPECLDDLRETAPVTELAAAVMIRVESGVGATRQAILLTEDGRSTLAASRNVTNEAVEDWCYRWSPPDGEQALTWDRDDPLFPLRIRLRIESGGKPETIGWLLLGPRPDGTLFGKDEREALAQVAGPIARSLHIAQVRRARDQRAEARLSAIEQLVMHALEAFGRKISPTPQGSR